MARVPLDFEPKYTLVKPDTAIQVSDAQDWDRIFDLLTRHGVFAA
jgi:hypothetical protein